MNAATASALIEDPVGLWSFLRNSHQYGKCDRRWDGDLGNIDDDVTRILMKPDLRVIGL